MPDGSRETQVFTTPINFRADDGDLAKIDNDLVPTSEPGYQVENQANSYQLLIPSDAGSKPVKFEADKSWVSFAADGVDGAPRVEGNEATLDGIAPNTHLEYEAVAGGVKETIVLANQPSDRARYDFELNTSPGLTPHLADDGGLKFVDANGEPVFTVPEPFMTDSSGTDGALSTDVSFELQATATGWRLSVVPLWDWLTDPSRVYPVRIDPTISAQRDGDCWVSEAFPDSPNCGAGSDFLRVGMWNDFPRRSLLRFDMESIPEGASVTDAKLSLYIASGETTAVRTAEYVVRRATRHWSGQATWRTTDGTTRWSAAGGDYQHSEGLGEDMNGSTNGYRTFDLTDMVVDWTDGTQPNHGVFVKQKFENVDSMIAFFSCNSSDETRWPKLSISYDPPIKNTVGDVSFGVVSDVALTTASDGTIPLSQLEAAGVPGSQVHEMVNSGDVPVPPADVFSDIEPDGDGSIIQDPDPDFSLQWVTTKPPGTHDILAHWPGREGARINYRRGYYIPPKTGFGDAKIRNKHNLTKRIAKIVTQHPQIKRFEGGETYRYRSEAVLVHCNFNDVCYEKDREWVRVVVDFSTPKPLTRTKGVISAYCEGKERCPDWVKRSIPV